MNNYGLFGNDLKNGFNFICHRGVELTSQWKDHAVESVQTLSLNMQKNQKTAYAVFVVANGVFFILLNASAKCLKGEKEKIYQNLAIDTVIVAGGAVGANLLLAKLTDYKLSQLVLAAIAVAQLIGRLVLRKLEENAQETSPATQPDNVEKDKKTESTTKTETPKETGDKQDPAVTGPTTTEKGQETTEDKKDPIVPDSQNTQGEHNEPSAGTEAAEGKKDPESTDSTETEREQAKAPAVTEEVEGKQDSEPTDATMTDGDQEEAPAATEGVEGKQDSEPADATMIGGEQEKAPAVTEGVEGKQDSEPADATMTGGEQKEAPAATEGSEGEKELAATDSQTIVEGQEETSTGAEGAGGNTNPGATDLKTAEGEQNDTSSLTTPLVLPTETSSPTTPTTAKIPPSPATKICQAFVSHLQKAVYKNDAYEGEYQAFHQASQDNQSKQVNYLFSRAYDAFKGVSKADPQALLDQEEGVVQIAADSFLKHPEKQKDLFKKLLSCIGPKKRGEYRKAFDIKAAQIAPSPKKK